MKVWTDRVITIGRVSTKTWRGPNYKVLKHTVLFGTHDIIGVLKKDGTEYEPDSLGSMYNSLDRHLRDMKSQIGYVLTFLSFKIVNIHHKFA
jgi:hypothetical protein